MENKEADHGAANEMLERSDAALSRRSVLALARSAHPDRGGSTEAFTAVMEAYAARHSLGGSGGAQGASTKDEATTVAAETGITITYLVGTMVELPRAAICADDLAREAEFFSFGTNDLTQTALGISRDDAGAFIHAYTDAEIYPIDPFVSIDVEGVGALVRMGVERGRETRGDIKLGICGEHGGDPASISFFESVDLDYISCSPYRVPAARLAAAQATIRNRG